MGITPNHHHHHHHHHHQSSPFLTTKLISRIVFILTPLALLHFLLSPHPLTHLIPTHPKSHPNPTPATSISITTTPTPRHCNYTDGRWAQSAGGPPYNGTTCRTIKNGQNCMANGRPDSAYLHWRWQPTHCPLPPFHPPAFLSLIRHKHVAFIGDSMARNQLESLLCLLSSASPGPRLVYQDGDDKKFRRWVFPSHNATVSVFWSPFLVRGVEKSAPSGLDHNKLYLDSADERWASELGGLDVVVFSVGHWFLHPAIYHESGQVLGCHHCPGLNHTEIGFFDVFRKAMRTTLRVVRERSSSDGRETLVVVTTFSPAHFEGEWDKAGACPKEEPYREGEKEMEYMDAEMRRIEVEEVAAAAAAEEGRTVRFEALDVTRMALMRPDGHPGPYMYPNPFAGGPRERVQNDCVHWCLPGPIDAWNEILLQSFHTRQHLVSRVGAINMVNYCQSMPVFHKSSDHYTGHFY